MKTSLGNFYPPRPGWWPIPSHRTLNPIAPLLVEIQSLPGRGLVDSLSVLKRLRNFFGAWPSLPRRFQRVPMSKLDSPGRHASRMARRDRPQSRLLMQQMTSAHSFQVPSRGTIASSFPACPAHVKRMDLAATFSHISGGQQFFPGIGQFYPPGISRRIMHRPK